MHIAFGALTVAAALFLFLWYRTIASLPASRQLPFAATPPFKWGIPGISVVVFAMGLYLLSLENAWIAASALGLTVAIAGVFLKFDRYSASMRIIYDRYAQTKSANPAMEEIEVLYHTARWRYPKWDHDRLVELVAGKDIEAVMLLIVIGENRIHPISDWELYRDIKAKAARIARQNP
jgi:hypothetical protein